MDFMNIMDWIAIVLFFIAFLVIFMPMLVFFLVCAFAPVSSFPSLE